MPRVLVASAAQIYRLLSTSRAIAAVEDAFRSLADGEVQQPLRTVFPAGSGLFFDMPAAVGHYAGVKALTLLEANAGTNRPVIQGLVTLFDARTGNPVAILDAASLTAIRTAAASAVATRHMAREDAHVLAILGSGVQARTHFDAICAVREVREIRVWSRSSAQARHFANVVRPHHFVRACDTAEEAVRGADIVCCVTGSPTPLLPSAAFADGAHINAVGAHTRRTRELDGATIARSRFVVDSMESARAECGELALAVAEGACTEQHIAAELADVVMGRAAGRTSERELTVFKSLGLAMEDVYAAAAVLEAARDDVNAQWVTL